MFSNSKSTQTFNISINGVNIMRVCAVKFLRVYIDDKLNLKKHITYICNKLSKIISILYIACQTLNANDLATLYCSLFLPYISYSAEVWCNIYPSNILPVLLKQKKAVRIIARAEYLHHTDKSFYYMKLLTVDQVIELQSLTFMYKAFKGLLPVNLQTYFI